jgi:lipooligosaccharide transport system permease protein
MRESISLWLHITRRNWAVYRQDLLANTSPTLADPALNLVALGIGVGAFVTQVDGMTYVQYLAPGLTMTTALFTAFFETSWGFFVRMTYEHVFKAMLTTPIGPEEIVLGEFIWVALKGAFMALGVAIVLALLGLMQQPAYLPLIAVTGFFIALPCGAMGLIASSFVRNINQFQTVYAFIIAPLYFLSGAFAPLDSLPKYVQYIGDLFPVSHGVKIAQALFWDRAILETIAWHGSILLLQCLCFGAIAFYSVRRKLVS